MPAQLGRLRVFRAHSTRNSQAFSARRHPWLINPAQVFGQGLTIFHESSRMAHQMHGASLDCGSGKAAVG